MGARASRPSAAADPLTCSMTAYKPAPGLTAALAGDSLAVTWDGANGSELRVRFGIERGTPTIRELAVRHKGGAWATLAANVTPEFRVAELTGGGPDRGLRRTVEVPETDGLLGEVVPVQITAAW